MNEKQMIVTLVLLSYLVRLIISPFYVMFPHIPHDFYAYVGLGKCMVEGKYLMFVCTEWGGRQGEISAYGPFFATLMGGWYSLFGEFNFYGYKLLSVLFDVLNTLIVYLIGKRLFDKEKAFHLAIIYCLSFIALFNSAVLGNDDIIAMSFVLLSLYFLINGKLKTSAVFLSVSIMFKIVGIVCIPAILYYVYRKYNLRNLVNYIFVSGISFLLFLSPFIFLAGSEKALYYIIGSTHTTGQTGAYMSFYNIFRYITNINISFLVIPILITSYLVTFILFFVKRLKNKELELFRNMALFWIASLLFGGILVAPQQYLIFVFMLFLLFTEKRHFSVIGSSLIIFSLLIFSMIYRWGIVQYSTLDRALLLLMTITSPVGVFLFLKGVKLKFRIIWSFIILAVVMWSVTHAAPLLVLPIDAPINVQQFTVINDLYGDHIQGSSKIFISYALFYAGASFLMWLSLPILYYQTVKEKW